MTILTWGTLVKRRFNEATYKLKQAFPDAPHCTSLTPTWIAKTSNCSNSGSCRMSDIFPPLINLTELVRLCSNFARFASKYLKIESPTQRMRSEEDRSVMSLLSRKEDWLVTVGAGEGLSQAASQAATLEETCELVHVDETLVVRGCDIPLVTEGLDSPTTILGEDTSLAVGIQYDSVLSQLLLRTGHSSSSMTPWLLNRENALTAELVLG